MTDRILWNRRPSDPRDTGNIDEIVVHNCTVHIEQMGDDNWSVMVTKGDAFWCGLFQAEPRRRMRFGESFNEGLSWDRDDSHDTEEAK